MFSREEIQRYITPHALRTLNRVSQSKGNRFTEDMLKQAGLSDEAIRAMIQTRRIVPIEGDFYKQNWV
ncbi:hypothetical protein DNHGIG_28780 [Collibacillus ludicampi]|uniref:Uncharacterized protein n=1 Tax=Collibacillus ludicampi TaxID=2771369 RepID=A0AAV4LHZ8_9BACL|nr:hypothetical protein [Collibacillus ludicampi]GIM47329.1 hypothetical protein DNHGIG_28780 [Collibacillus ludicampi]